MKKSLIILAAVAMALIAVPTAGAQQKIVTGGSTGLQVLASALAEEYGRATKKKVRVTVSGGGSGAGITGANTGRFQIGNSSRDKNSRDAADLVFTPITKEPFAVIVNRANPIKGLTAKQVEGIFLGEITNWNQVGWAQGGAIKCFSRVATSGTRGSFEKLFLNGKPVANNCPALASNALDRSATANARGGIAFVTYMYTVGAGGRTVKTLPIDGVTPSLRNTVTGRYKFWNCQYFVTKGQPAGEVKTYIDWVRTNAKAKRVTQKYAVPYAGSYESCL